MDMRVQLPPQAPITIKKKVVTMTKRGDSCNNEAILVGFKVILDRKGRLVTEICGLPLEQVLNVFKKDPNKHMYYALVRESRTKIDKLIKHLERELGAF